VKVLVCGGRNYANRERVYRVLDRFLEANNGQGFTLIVGGASGADSLAGEWGYERHMPVEVYQADWDAHGRMAGCKRNQRMLDEGRPWRVIAFPGGPGTADMVRRAKRARIKVWEIPW
jgi:hypothetical protein